MPAVRVPCQCQPVWSGHLGGPNLLKAWQGDDLELAELEGTGVGFRSHSGHKLRITQNHPCLDVSDSRLEASQPASLMNLLDDRVAQHQAFVT